MKKLLPILILLCVPAHADTRIDNMVRSCEAVMAQDVCRVELDRRSFKNPTVLIVNSSGPVRISTDSYVRIRNSGAQMCAVVRNACTSAWDGDDCKAARALWSQK